MKYHEPLFRPPAEGNSLIFQIAYGCPHNKCSFCGMYKGTKYQVRQIEDVFNEMQLAASLYPKTRRVFLADGDVMFLDFELLEMILSKLNKYFPNLARVNIYANGTSILAKSERELQRLSDMKLNTLYMGLESGDDKILNLVHKDEKVDDMVTAVATAQKNGLKCSVMALLGLGGKFFSMRHAKLTANAISRMQPRLFSILRFIEVRGTKMYEKYEPLSEYDAVKELYEIVLRLKLEKTVFTANHASNPLPIKGRFPQDKQKFLNIINDMLLSNQLDRDNVGQIPFWL